MNAFSIAYEGAGGRRESAVWIFTVGHPGSTDAAAVIVDATCIVGTEMERRVAALGERR